MKLSYGPETPYLKYHPKKMKALPQKDTCTILFIAELQQARYRNHMCSLMYEWIKKIHRYTHWNIDTHTLDYYSVTKNNEICMFAISCIHLEGIMLSGISQTEKPNTIGFHLQVECKNKTNQPTNVIDTDNMFVVAISRGSQLGKMGERNKKYKLLVQKLVSHGNVTYSIMTTLFDTLLHSKVTGE